MADTFQPAGNFNLIDAVLIDDSNKTVASIKPAIINFSMIESINKKAYSATITLADVNDTLRRFPVFGHELISVTWQTPSFKEEESEPRSAVFRITRITNVTPSTNTPGIAFSIDLISEYGYHQDFLVIEEAYTDTVSNVVKLIHNKILSESVGNYKVYDADSLTLNIDETDAVFDFIIPSDTPFDTYDYLLSWAYLVDYPSNVFYAFQNNDGFNFKNIEKHIDDKIIQIKENDSYLKTRTYTYTNSESVLSENSQYVISNFQQLNRNDLYSLAKSGRMRNTVSELDYVQKRVELYDFRYKDIRDKMKFPEAGLLTSDDYVDGYGEVITENTWIYRDSTRPTKRLAESIGYKWAFHKLLYNNMLQLKVPGNSALTAGDVVKLKIPAFNATNPDNVRREDKSLSGYYLVKDIYHNFTTESYEMDVVVCRIGAELKDNTEL